MTAWIALYIIAAYFSFGVIGLFLTYHNPKSPFYGRLDVEAICLGLVASPGWFLSEMWDLFVRATGLVLPASDKVVFKRKS